MNGNWNSRQIYIVYFFVPFKHDITTCIIVKYNYICSRSVMYA